MHTHFLALLVAAWLCIMPLLAQQTEGFTETQQATLMKTSMIAADQFIADAQKAIEKIESKRQITDADEVVRARATMIKSYSENYKLKHELRQQIQAHQLACQQAEARGGEALETLQAMNSEYRAAVTTMRELAEQYKTQFRVAIPDPYAKAVQHFFPPDPTRGNRQ